jgi:hypothetical protein
MLLTPVSLADRPMASAPLVRGFGVGAAFAYRKGCRLGVARFLWDVTRLAALLPDRRYLVNLCADRYHFAVGFAAALLRRQVSLLPPNETPDLIGRLVSRYPDAIPIPRDGAFPGVGRSWDGGAPGS